MVTAVSTRAEYVSGGDVLVEVRAHDQGAARHLRIEVDGNDVSSAFHQMPDGTMLGLVTGLTVGPHTIVARANGSGRGTPAGHNKIEYWAAGVEAYFDAAGAGLPPSGTDRPITTREALKSYDPELWTLVDETMAYKERVDWRAKR